MGTGKSACATQGCGPTLQKGWGTREIGATIGARGKSKRAQARVPVPLKDADPPFRKGGAPEKPAPQSALEAKANGHRQECLCHSRMRTHPSERVGTRKIGTTIGARDKNKW